MGAWKLSCCMAAGAIVLPLELLQFDEKYRPAMLKAFGSLVIVDSDQLAEELIRKHGIPSITKAGQISRQSTLEGGWRETRSTVLRMSVKLSADRSKVGSLKYKQGWTLG